MKILAIGTTSGDLFLWYPKEKAAERIQGISPVTSLAFSRDGNSLAIGREDGSLSVLSLKTKKIMEVSNAHAGAVEALRFGLGGGRWISSLSQDAVQFWDSGDWSKIGTLIFPPRGGTLSWLFVTPTGLFEGESRALGSMLWRFSPHLTDVTPVELFERDCQGLMKYVLLGQQIPEPRVCKPPALRSRNPNVAVLKLEVDIKDKSQTVTTPRVTVHIHIQRVVTADGEVEGVKDVRLFRGGLLVKHWHGMIPISVQDLSAEIPITPGLNEFTAYAFNPDNVKSLDATGGVLGDRSLAKLGTTYILSVGACCDLILDRQTSHCAASSPISTKGAQK